MPILFQTPDGRKIAKASGVADNSAGGAAASIDVEITVGELEKVLDVISVYIVDSGDTPSTLKSLTVSGNKVTATVTVAAGQTATVTVVVLGY